MGPKMSGFKLLTWLSTGSEYAELFTH